MSSFDTTISSLGLSSTKASSASAKATGNATTLDQSSFLKLMTAQMQNQDPFNPVDNTQMVAQMAQFSSLAGISEMSTTLKAISDKLGATSTADAVSYVGRTVLTAGDTAYPRTTGGIAGAIELGGAASDVSVKITGPDGTVLKTLALGAQGKGTVSYDWDGMTDAGAAAGSGPYTVAVAAKNADGAVAATGLVWAPVESVATSASGVTLTLSGLGSVSAANVRQIG